MGLFQVLFDHILHAQGNKKSKGVTFTSTQQSNFNTIEGLMNKLWDVLETNDYKN